MCIVRLSVLSKFYWICASSFVVLFATWRHQERAASFNWLFNHLVLFALVNVALNAYDCCGSWWASEESEVAELIGRCRLILYLLDSGRKGLWGCDVCICFFTHRVKKQVCILLTDPNRRVFFLLVHDQFWRHLLFGYCLFFLEWHLFDLVAYMMLKLRELLCFLSWWSYVYWRNCFFVLDASAKEFLLFLFPRRVLFTPIILRVPLIKCVLIFGSFSLLSTTFASIGCVMLSTTNNVPGISIFTSRFQVVINGGPLILHPLLDYLDRTFRLAFLVLIGTFFQPEVYHLALRVICLAVPGLLLVEEVLLWSSVLLLVLFVTVASVLRLSVLLVSPLNRFLLLKCNWSTLEPTASHLSCPCIIAKNFIFVIRTF